MEVDNEAARAGRVRRQRAELSVSALSVQGQAEGQSGRAPSQAPHLLRPQQPMIHLEASPRERTLEISEKRNGDISRTFEKKKVKETQILNAITKKNHIYIYLTTQENEQEKTPPQHILLASKDTI